MPYKNEDPRLRGSSKGYTVRKHTQRLHCLVKTQAAVCAVSISSTPLSPQKSDP